MLDALVLDGTVTLIALGVLVVEIAAILVIARSRAPFRPAGYLLANAVSGLFLILALRAALVQSGAVAIVAFLGLAFLAHVAGLAAFLRQR